MDVPTARDRYRPSFSALFWNSRLLRVVDVEKRIPEETKAIFGSPDEYQFKPHDALKTGQMKSRRRTLLIQWILKSIPFG